VAPLGATEAIILDAQGAIVEGAYSSVVVWTSGSDALTIVPRSTPRLPGITEQVVLDIAQREGVRVEERTLFPQDLDNATVWILSALHGIRQAVSWVDGPTLSRSQSLRDAWQNTWLRLAAPVHPGA
jgi:branched-subunit amino acid aminotransferase/4-amino-4-deoxychorismate lyase